MSALNHVTLYLTDADRAEAQALAETLEARGLASGLIKTYGTRKGKVSLEALWHLMIREMQQQVERANE